MFKTTYHARVGFTRVIDRSCPSCKGIYSSREHSMCPKCGVPLVIPTTNTTKGVRPYCFTEVTIFPIFDTDFQKYYADRIIKAKSMGYSIRLKIWGKYDEQNNIAVPSGRTPYLTPGKHLIVETNTPPLYSVFKTKEGAPVLQIIHEIGRNDTITFTGAKESVATAEATRNTIAPPPAAKPAPAATGVAPQNNDLATLGNMIKGINDMFANMVAANAANVAAKPAVTQNAPAPTEIPVEEYDNYAYVDEQYNYELINE